MTITIYLLFTILFAFGEGFRTFSPSNSFSSSFLRRSKRTELYGIPKLFRWLVDLYPTAVESFGDLDQRSFGVDNFYLDMNGIIHACTHANDGQLVKIDEKQMLLKIFDYTDRLFKLVKPSRLLFLAVDGVAPRAKLNQQRSRRFRAAKEREYLLAQEENQLLRTESFDSNCITPGTDFMYRLGSTFRTWIEYKMSGDPHWQTGVEVVFSGPDVPGEGEHKIMDKIRAEQRNVPFYKEKSYSHCMYGLDADLVMLGLVTHEQNFALLRERNYRSALSEKQEVLQPEDFEVLQLAALRAMLKLHFDGLDVSADRKMKIPSTKRTPQEWKEPAAFSPSDNLERLIDDFVFMLVTEGHSNHF
jgi:5'-3' exoribonuclease 1